MTPPGPSARPPTRACGFACGLIRPHDTVKVSGMPEDVRGRTLRRQRASLDHSDGSQAPPGAATQRPGHPRGRRRHRLLEVFDQRSTLTFAKSSRYSATKFFLGEHRGELRDRERRAARKGAQAARTLAGHRSPQVLPAPHPGLGHAVQAVAPGKGRRLSTLPPQEERSSGSSPSWRSGHQDLHRRLACAGAR